MTAQRAVHICRFRGKVLPGKPPKGARCEMSDDDLPWKGGWPQRCRRRAVHGVLLAWGASMLCAKHAREETT